MRDGLIFYNPGTSKQDFLLLEVSNYSLTLTIKLNERSVKLYVPQKSVADGKWNQVINKFYLLKSVFVFAVVDH